MKFSLHMSPTTEYENALVKAGINHIHMCPPTQGYDETLDMFIEEVMPALK